ncbi:MAG: adenylate kinase, partial [Deltaproteobacteria bacterium]|nr:adenylate kinase [Deltaproteobacteria bacterium]
YNNQTAPLIQYYADKDLLRKVQGVGPIEEIFGRIEKAIL